MFKFQDQKDIKVEDYMSVWKNGGEFQYEDSVHKVTMADALSHPNSTKFFPITIQTIIREAIEPQLIGSSLLEQIQYVNGMLISQGAVGATTAEEIGEGSEYPEISLNYGPGAQAITIGKYGIALKYTDEMKRYSKYDELGIALRAMSKALARKKEYQVWSMFERMGIVTHDNANPAGSVFGTTTGYDELGAANGSLNLDDIYEAYGQMLMNGFTPNALIVHPLTYTMFLTDPVLRAFAVNHGAGAWYNGWNGNPVNADPFTNGILGKRGPAQSLFSSSTDPASVNVNASPKIPAYLGLPLTVIVSPLVPYNIATKTTSIYLVDTNNIGALVTDELPVMEEVPDRLRDITKVKVRERYAIVPYHEGHAVCVLKNVKAIPNKFLPMVQPTISNWTKPNRANAIN